MRDGTTNEKGIACLARMPAHRQVDIELGESTLAESELRSRIPGVSVISRPGSYAVVEFPIVRTAELEGHVRLEDGDTGKALSRALVLLKSLDFQHSGNTGSCLARARGRDSG